MTQTCSSGRVRIVDTEMNLQSQYVVTLYWMTTTMTQVGYGDLTPRTEFEVLALIISMLAGAAIFSQIVGNATQMILEVKGHDAIVDQELDGPPLNAFPPPPKFREELTQMVQEGGRTLPSALLWRSVREADTLHPRQTSPAL
jgi:hypothetical protein